MGELAAQSIRESEGEDDQSIRESFPTESDEFQNFHGVAWTAKWWDQKWEDIMEAAHVTMAKRDPDLEDRAHEYACPVCNKKFKGCFPDAVDTQCNALYNHLNSKASNAKSSGQADMHPSRNQVKAWDSFWN